MDKEVEKDGGDDGDGLLPDFVTQTENHNLHELQAHL